MRQQSLILFLVFLGLSPALLSQTAKMERSAIRPVYKFNPFIFCDLVRESGVGLECYVKGRFFTELRAGYIVPNFSPFQNLVTANDYFKMKGISISVLPKFYLGKKSRAYIGPWISYQSYGYTREIVYDTYYYTNVNIDFLSVYSNTDYSYKVTRNRSTKSFVLGLNYGMQCHAEAFYLEPFVNLGLGYASSQSEVYNVASTSNSYYGTGKGYPQGERNQKVEPYLALGIKIGIGVMKPKKYENMEVMSQNLLFDINSLSGTIDDLYAKKQISLIAKNNGLVAINKLRTEIGKMVFQDIDTSEYLLSVNENLYKIIADLKPRTFRVGTYNSDVLYKKPDGTTQNYNPFKGDLYDSRERIVNYSSFIIADSEKEELFKLKTH